MSKKKKHKKKHQKHSNKKHSKGAASARKAASAQKSPSEEQSLTEPAPEALPPEASVEETSSGNAVETETVKNTEVTEDTKEEYMDVYIRYNRAGLKEHYALTAQILNVKEESFRLLHNDSEFFRLEDEKQNEIHKEIRNGRYAYSHHEQLIRLETGVFGGSTMNALAAAAVLVIIIIIFIFLRQTVFI